MTAVPYQVLGIISVLLLVAVAPMPYGFYTFVKIIVCGSAGVTCYQLWDKGHKGAWLYVWGAIAILFNPLIPISMEKEIWMFVDAVAGLIFFYSAYGAFNKQKLNNSGEKND